MRKLSIWASHHKLFARLLVTAGFLLLYVVGIKSGRIMQNLNIDLPFYWLGVASILFFGLQLNYPHKQKKAIWGSTKFFIRQKSTDMALALSLFLLIIFVGNHRGFAFRDMQQFISSANATVPSDSSRSYKTGREFAAAMRDENGKLLKWKERKKLLKSQIRAVRRSELNSGGQVALIILCLLLAAGLAYGVAALSCGLACNDQGALAIIVAIGGLFLVVWGAVKVIRSILKKKETPPS